MIKSKMWSGAAAVLALCCASGAHAASPFDSLRGCTAVPNQVLAHMRGRYARFGDIEYFGVRMETRWTTASGTVINSDVSLGIGAGSGQNPSVGYQVNTSVVQGTGSAANGNGANNVGSNIGGQGVTQVIQLASDGNSANNNVTVNVTNVPSTSGTGDSNGGNGQGSTSSGGIVVNAGINGNGVGTSIVVAGQGTVTQQLNGGNGGLMQNVLVSSGMNQVQNNLTLTLGLAPGTGLGAHGIPNEVVNTTMGLPRVGL